MKHGMDTHITLMEIQCIVTNRASERMSWLMHPFAVPLVHCEWGACQVEKAKPIEF